LVFIEIKNNIQSVIAYIACLKANKVIYLLDDLKEEKTKQLIKQYKPNIIIDGLGEIQRYCQTRHSLHKELTLLLSTSGTTGTAKFVKLSVINLHSNASSIAQYLKLTENDIALAHLKLHYSYGLSILHSHLLVGATTAFTDKSILDNEFWEHLKTYSATSFAGVPYTFEALLKTGFNLHKYPSLRYITQAGGKLEAPLVKKYVQHCVGHNVDFFVMYGQTEAAPRISYLPPELAMEFPGTIGGAIPGGKLFLLDEKGEEISALDTAGELAYQGDNVMMGYAHTLADLASDESPELLLTGDIACRTKYDLFYIIGRSKRFVKLFGLRVNLDDVQSYVHSLYPQSAVAGDDRQICVALEKVEGINKKQLKLQLSAQYGLPEESFKIKLFAKLPLLVSGKYDYKKILQEEAGSPGIFSKILSKIAATLELNNNQWESITALFCEALNIEQLQPDLNFNMLTSDSLSFVYLSTELEQCLGDALPENWQQCSLAELEQIYDMVRAD
jgi:long-chain acyl-CoA synthetase